MQVYRFIERWRRLIPGIMTSALIAMAAAFLSEHHGGPTLVYALLVGMAFYFLSQGSPAAPGIHFTARTILRLGVALLGVRISLGQIVDLGAAPVVIIVVGVAATILVGRFLAAPMGLNSTQGVLTGGAVAICGASAALAIAAVLPATKDSERDTLFTVIAVTVLSTLAMILYPLLIRLIGTGDHAAGILLGGTIHAVAQVVGAGYLISDQTGIVATYIKLLRVALLLPVVTILVWAYRKSTPGAGAPRQPLLPSFLVAFAVLAAVNSLGWIPASVSDVLASVSRWCLICAIAALGMKTSLQELANVGWRPLALVVAESVFLLAFVLIALKFLGRL